MFKKLLIASAVLATTTSVAFAGAHYKTDLKNEMPCPTYVFPTGPYIGFSIGPVVNVPNKPANYVGINGILSAGYSAFVASNFYLAGEIFVQDNANVQNRGFVKASTGKNVDASSSWGYGLSILPGMMINERVLGYIRAGVINSHFNHATANGNSLNKTGGQLGLGTETALNTNWDLRTEYVYSSYSGTGGIGVPHSHEFNLGVVYKFI